MGLAARALFCCVESQIRQTAQVEEYSLLNVRKPKQYMPAKRTSCDQAWALHIQMRLGKAPSCAAIGTLSFGGRNIHCEYSA
jgi:hypothetical protein